MAEFGSFSVVLALTFCIYAMFALFYGAKSGRRDLVKSGEHAVYAVFAFVTLAVVALETLLLRSDFSIEYVAGYSNRDLPFFYKLAALWGGQFWLQPAFSRPVGCAVDLRAPPEKAAAARIGCPTT